MTRAHTICRSGRLRTIAGIGSLTLLFAGSIAAAEMKPPASDARQGVVVTVSEPASDVGAEILARGGNAVDAAIATAFALAVTYPPAGNIGGGGFMLIYPGDGTAPAGFDFREVAPKAATRDMFVRPADRTPHRRVGVPGTVRGLALAHQRFGKLAWKELVSPAVRLAGEGFALDAALAKSLNDILKIAPADANAELRRVFARPDGTAWKEGDLLKQPELKATLEQIAEHGAEGFYAGPVAELLAKEMQRGEGLITTEDLKQYRAIERKPLRGTYRGHEIHCMPPPSSGGTALIEMLNILESFEIAKQDRWSPRTVHLLAESARRAYRDRACYLGDPGFTNVPAKLLDKDYAKELAAGIDLERATPSADLAGEIKLSEDGEQTTHFSVIGADGTAVSMTYTLESSYGSKVVVRGAGFLLNDEMNDFNPLPGVTDRTGRIGTLPNQVSPGKRMLSSMSPTIVTRNGKPLLVTGSPGGRTIINTVLCVVVNVVDFGMSAREAVDAPRFHHQWFPDRLRIESELFKQHPELRRSLEKLGHAVDSTGRQGDAHTIWIDPQTGEPVGVPDHRIRGKATTASSAARP